MNEQEVASLLQTARLAAREAGRLLEERWQEPKQITQKGFRHWVTDADIALQRTITTIVQDRHPAHGFLAEEESSHLPLTGEVVWIIDPIDGTTNFSRGQPNVCISIAAMARGHVQAGVIYDPLRDELFSATRVMPSQLNEEAIHVSDTKEAGNAVIGFDWAHSSDDRQATLDSLHTLGHSAKSLRSIGSAALALAWVACGRLDAYWNWHLNAWDLAAGALLIEQAGGRCTDIQQRPLVMSQPGSCLASNRALHSELSDLLFHKSSTKE